jgi:glycerol-3-phosphate cytidylyltransferase-like family protein
MATQAAPKAVQQPAKKPDLVSVGSDLRKAFDFIEALAQSRIDAEIEKRRADERTKGPQLLPEVVRVLSDELETIQQSINPLKKRQESIRKKILTQWGHSGISEIEGELGNSLISTSAQLALDPDVLLPALDEKDRKKMVRSVLHVQALLLRAANDVEVQQKMKEAIRVKKLLVSITPPSSRGQAGSPEDQETENEAE